MLSNTYTHNPEIRADARMPNRVFVVSQADLAGTRTTIYENDTTIPVEVYLRTDAGTTCRISTTEDDAGGLDDTFPLNSGATSQPFRLNPGQGLYGYHDDGTGVTREVYILVQAAR